MNLRSARSSRRGQDATIDITPLIDIVFILLIFFLLTSSVSQQSSDGQRDSAIPIDLPEASAGAEEVQGDPLTLTVTEDGRVELEGGGELEGASVEEKLANLYKQNPEAQILMRGDKGADYGRVVELLDGVKKIGFKRVDLIIQKQE
jgi:biopolymer transport protein ExbD